MLVNEYGWTKAETEWLETYAYLRGGKVGCPSKSPKEDEAGMFAPLDCAAS